jgi:Ca2+-binding EF-hand superfamily protein
MRLYEFFTSANKKSFVYGLGKLARPEGNEFYEALLQIYDVNNQGHFSVEELITLVRFKSPFISI